MAITNDGQPAGPIQFTDVQAGKRFFIGANTPGTPTDGDIWLDADILNNAGQNLLATVTLSGASTDLSVLSLYKNMHIVFRGVRPSVDATVLIRVNDDATNYASGTALYSIANFKAGVTTNHMSLEIIDTQDTTSFSWGYLKGFYTNSSNVVTTIDSTGIYTQTTALSKITISLSTGTFSGGTALVYGVN
jgi:hypothetical protein